MSKFLKDLKFGLNKEMQLLPILKEYLKDETIYKLENSNVFDFKGDNKFIELKSRNNNYDKYPTTMIGINKVLRASSLNENVYFFFWFVDGLYYWLYDKDYEFEIKRSGRFDRGRPELNDYAYIPIDMLIKVY
jgi:hypothetical protein